MEHLVADGKVADLAGVHEGQDVRLQPSKGSVGAARGKLHDVLVWHTDHDPDPGALQGCEDSGDGDEEANLGDAMRLEQLDDDGGGGEIVAGASEAYAHRAGIAAAVDIGGGGRG